MGKADAVLVIVLIGFVIALYCDIVLFPGNVLAKFFHVVFDAALVGALADWFAVTAIFEHPLGLAIPHTAILPSQRNAFASGAAGFVKKKLLSQKRIVSEVRGLHIGTFLSEAVSKRENQEKIIGYLLEFFQEQLRTLQTSGSHHEMAERVRTMLLEGDIRKTLRRLLRWLKEEDHTGMLLSMLSPLLLKWLKSEEGNAYVASLIREKAEETNVIFRQLGEWAGIYNHEELVDVSVEQLQKIAWELGRKDSDLQQHIVGIFLYHFEELVKDADFIRFMETFRARLLPELPLESLCSMLFAYLNKRFNEEGVRTLLAEKAESAFRSHVAEVLHLELRYLLEILRTEQTVQKELDAFLHKAAGHLGLAAQEMTADIVSKALANMTDEQLNDIVRSKVQGDLSFIRINGSVVGSLIGALLFLLMQLIHAVA